MYKIPEQYYFRIHHARPRFKENVENAFQTFSTFWEVSEEYRTDCYKEVWNKLMEIKNE